MGHSVYIIINNHNILPFALLTFPVILPFSVLIRLCHKCLDLNLWQFVPSLLCKMGCKGLQLIITLSYLVPSSKASRVADNCLSFSNFSSFSLFLT